jgi:hypothetical protein
MLEERTAVTSESFQRLRCDIYLPRKLTSTAPGAEYAPAGIAGRKVGAGADDFTGLRRNLANFDRPLPLVAGIEEGGGG